MNELQTFNFEQNNIRTVTIDDEPWFVGKDVCEYFGDTNYRRSLSRLDDDEKGVSQIATPGGDQNVVIINEAGLYSLLFNFQPEKAKGVSQNDDQLKERVEKIKKFKKFVTSEVLPAIRKHGGYLTEQKIEEALLNPDTLIELATNLKEEREKRKALEAEKQENKPYVSFAKSVEASVNSVLIGMFAKTLSEENGVKIGQNRLFEWLRKNGYLMDIPGERYNTPYQKYIDNGYFEVATLTFAGTTGTHQKFTTKITGKGQISLAQKIVDAFRQPVPAVS